MRVTVERREQTYGLLGNRRNYFADFIVQFSEEERAVIKARGLSDVFFTIRTPNPPRSPQFQFALSLAGPIGLFVGSFALFYAILFLVLGTLIGINYSKPLLILSLVGFGVTFLWLYERLTAKGIEQRVPIGTILQNLKFTVWAHDPADLKMIEAEAKDQLRGVKQRIVDSVEMKDREAYEL
jgi:hypothetical protein